MFESNPAISGVVREFASAACQRLFAAYGVQLVPASDENRAVDGIVLCGVLGFTGSEIRGSLLLAGTQGPFLRSRPAQGELRDWVGELTNQLLGRLKVQLLERGAHIALSTPVVLQGEHIAPLPRQVLIPLVFHCDDGVVLVWTHVESAPGYELGSTSEHAIRPTAEDEDALFF